jgi:hypothetical protein
MNWIDAKSDLKPPRDIVVIGEVELPCSGSYKNKKTIYASFTFCHHYKRWKLFGITDYNIEALMDKNIATVMRWLDPNETMHYVVSMSSEKISTFDGKEYLH